MEIDSCRATPDGVLILSLESEFAEADWRALDTARSRLMRKGMTIVVGFPKGIVSEPGI